MKIKLILIAISFLLSNAIYGMDRPQSLRPNKQAKIEIIQKQFEKVFNHIDADKESKKISQSIMIHLNI